MSSGLLWDSILRSICLPSSLFSVFCLFKWEEGTGNPLLHIAHHHWDIFLLCQGQHLRHCHAQLAKSPSKAAWPPQMWKFLHLRCAVPWGKESVHTGLSPHTPGTGESWQDGHFSGSASESSHCTHCCRENGQQGSQIAQAFCYQMP